MDWFAEADYAAGQFLRDIFDKKVTEEQVRNNPVVAQNYVSITNGSHPIFQMLRNFLDKKTILKLAIYKWRAT